MFVCSLSRSPDTIGYYAQFRVSITGSWFDRTTSILVSFKLQIKTLKRRFRKQLREALSLCDRARSDCTLQHLRQVRLQRQTPGTGFYLQTSFNLRVQLKRDGYDGGLPPLSQGLPRLTIREIASLFHPFSTNLFLRHNVLFAAPWPMPASRLG